MTHHPPLGKPDRLYTTREVAEIYQVSPATVRRWIREKRIKGFLSPGSQWRFTEEAVKSVLRYPAREA